MIIVCISQASSHYHELLIFSCENNTCVCRVAGSDVVRSILLFAKGKPLGPYGLDWLKIHLVNLTGMKKRYVGVS